MEPASLNALRQYRLARQAIDGGMARAGGPAKAQAETEPSALAKGVEEFSKVFETVDTAAQGLATGRTDAQAVVEALATAEIALESAVTIRNRVVEAYQELLRMPV